MLGDEKLESLIISIEQHFSARYGMKFELHEVRNILFPLVQHALQKEMLNTVGESNVIDLMGYIEKKLYSGLPQEIQPVKDIPAEVIPIKKEQIKKPLQKGKKRID
jgi:hypothetical protein